MFSQISSSPHCEAAQRAHFIGLRIAGITVDTQHGNEIKAHGVLAHGAFAAAQSAGCIPPARSWRQRCQLDFFRQASFARTVKI